MRNQKKINRLMKVIERLDQEIQDAQFGLSESPRGHIQTLEGMRRRTFDRVLWLQGSGS